MSRLSSSKIFIFPLSMLCITALTGTISMLPSTSADTSPIDDDITITVDSACTMGQTVLQSSNTLNPGETATIGSSRIAAYCNDSEGYAIYAIGYTGGEYGNTNLISAQNPNHTIPTGTSSALGNASYWNMQLTPGTASDPTTTTHIPAIENNFTTSSNIPANFTKVASYPSTTISQQQDPTTSGSYFTTTYQSHISTTQPAGVYTGQVQYVMVHPSSAPAPEVPKTISDLTYMQDFATLSSANKARVINSMAEGEQYILTDNRDNNPYYISKLTDGNIWMTQNLDLCIGCEGTATLTSENTDLNEYNSNAYTEGYSLDGQIITWSPRENTAIPNISNWRIHSYTPLSTYSQGSSCVMPIGDKETDSIGGCASSSGWSHRHYLIGAYYNWTAAIASNNSSNILSPYFMAANSICPAGWRLPVGQSGATVSASALELGRLLFTYGIISNITDGSYSEYSADGFHNIRRSPTYLVRSGRLSYDSPTLSGIRQYAGVSGYYWSSTIYGQTANNFAFSNNAVAPNVNVNRGMGLSIRCIAR